MFRLSVLLKTVRSQMLNDLDRALRYNSQPASSRSWFEIVPLGLAEVTSLSMISFSHSGHHTSALLLNPSLGTRCSAGNHTPCSKVRCILMAFGRHKDQHKLCNVRGTIGNIVENPSEVI